MVSLPLRPPRAMGAPLGPSLPSSRQGPFMSPHGLKPIIHGVLGALRTEADSSEASGLTVPHMLSPWTLMLSFLCVHSVQGHLCPSCPLTPHTALSIPTKPSTPASQSIPVTTARPSQPAHGVTSPEDRHLVWQKWQAKICPWPAGRHGATPRGCPRPLPRPPYRLSARRHTARQKCSAELLLPPDCREKVGVGRGGGGGRPVWGGRHAHSSQMGRQIHRALHPSGQCSASRGPAGVGDRLVRVWRGLGRLGGSFCHRQKLKRGFSQRVCVSGNTPGWRPPPG